MFHILVCFYFVVIVGVGVSSVLLLFFYLVHSCVNKATLLCVFANFPAMYQYLESWRFFCVCVHSSTIPLNVRREEEPIDQSDVLSLRFCELFLLYNSFYQRKQQLSYEVDFLIRNKEHNSIHYDITTQHFNTVSQSRFPRVCSFQNGSLAL